MKRNLFIAAFTLLAGVLFTNCEKESSCELIGNCPDTEVKLIDPANPLNPFDKIGADHNSGLVFLKNKHQAEIDSAYRISAAKAEQIVFTRSSQFAGSEPRLQVLLREKLQLKQDQLLRNFDFSNYNNLFTVLKLDDKTRKALTTSIEAVMKIEPGSIEATNAIINAIKEQERIILANDRLPNRDFALTMLAVWRYSNHHWSEEGGTPQAQRAKWWQIGLADAACGAIGFVLGGPAAGVGLGIGASELVAKNT
ncbi:MAG: hypothetical protein ACK4TA_10295 [Saprospiraceae bacterium]